MTISGWRGRYVSEGARRVFAVLDRYYEALQNGTADQLLPDPTFEEELPDPAAVIRDLDGAFYHEMRVLNRSTWRSYDAEPEFHRLMAINGGAPAVALVQELFRLFSSEEYRADQYRNGCR